MKRLFFTALLGLLPLSAMAQGQVECMPTDKGHAVLEEKYGEVPFFRGLSRDGHLVEVWIGDNSWSALATKPTEGGSISCLVDSGAEWEQVGNLPPNL